MDEKLKKVESEIQNVVSKFLSCVKRRNRLDHISIEDKIDKN